MPRTAPRFDFRRPVSYDPEAKRLFHILTRRQLLALAVALGLGECDYDLRSNQAGIAVSGEITLHADRLYVLDHGRLAWEGEPERFEEEAAEAYL